jgi:hypothetical protein
VTASAGGRRHVRYLGRGTREKRRIGRGGWSTQRRHREAGDCDGARSDEHGEAWGAPHRRQRHEHRQAEPQGDQDNFAGGSHERILARSARGSPRCQAARARDEGARARAEGLGIGTAPEEVDVCRCGARRAYRSPRGSHRWTPSLEVPVKGYFPGVPKWALPSCRSRSGHTEGGCRGFHAGVVGYDGSKRASEE